MNHAGSFFGYREKKPKPKLRVGGWTYTPPDPEVRLEYWSWDLLGPVPFQYDVYAGFSADEFPDDFVSFPFQSRLIIGTIRDAPADLILTYDGITEQPARRFGLGFARLEAARGFKIRSAEAGRPCRYQIIPMR